MKNYYVGCENDANSVIKKPLIKSRPTDLALILLAFFRQIALKLFEIRQYSCENLSCSEQIILSIN